MTSRGDRLGRIPRDAAGFASFVVFVAGLLVLAIVAGTQDFLSAPDIRALVERGGAWSPALYLVAASVLPLAWVPRGVLTTVAGALFGMWPGAALGLAGGLGGALVAYAVAVKLGYPFVARRAGVRGRRVLEFVRRRGFLAIVLGRLCPVLSCEAVSLASGLTAIPMRTYLPASVVGMVPGAILFSALGSSLVEPDAAWVTVGSAVAAVVLAAATAAVLWRYWRKEGTDYSGPPR